MKEYWKISHCAETQVSEEKWPYYKKKSEVYFRRLEKEVSLWNPHPHHQSVWCFRVYVYLWKQIVHNLAYRLKTTLPTNHLLPILWQPLFACCSSTQCLNFAPRLRVMLAVLVICFSNTFKLRGRTCTVVLVRSGFTKRTVNHWMLIL